MTASLGGPQSQQSHPNPSHFGLGLFHFQDSIQQGTVSNSPTHLSPFAHFPICTLLRLVASSPRTTCLWGCLPCPGKLQGLQSIPNGPHHPTIHPPAHLCCCFLAPTANEGCLAWLLGYTGLASCSEPTHIQTQILKDSECIKIPLFAAVLGCTRLALHCEKLEEK